MRPSREIASNLPQPGAGEEVTTVVPRETVRLNVSDVALVDASVVALPQDGAGDRIDLVEIDHLHAFPDCNLLRHSFSRR